MICRPNANVDQLRAAVVTAISEATDRDGDLVSWSPAFLSRESAIEAFADAIMKVIPALAPKLNLAEMRSLLWLLHATDCGRIIAGSEERETDLANLRAVHARVANRSVTP